MKKSILAFVLLLAGLSAGAQNDTVRCDANTRVQMEARNSTMISQGIQYDPHQFKAGRCLQASAHYDALSLGFAIASAVSYSGVIGTDRKTCNLFGTILGITAIASKVCSVSFKNKAGTELQLSAGTVKVTF